MALNPEDPQDIRRLRLAMDHSRSKMGPFQRTRIAAMAQYAGKHYGTNPNGLDRIPVNKIESLVDILGRQIAANNPTVMVSTFFENLLPMAATFEMRLNRLVKELDLVSTLREAVTDAMFCMGIIRTGHTVMNPTEDGYFTEVGGPYARSVSLDDFVIDMRVHRFDEVDFIGNRYRMPIDELIASRLYDEDEIDRLVSSEPNESGEISMEDDHLRDLALSLGTSVMHGEYRKYVDLWDVWLPGPNVIVTMADKGPQRAIRVAPFDGPEGGPYCMLSFGRVPNNLMPKSPVHAAMDLHLFINAAYRKVFRQADRQKEVTYFTGEAAEDMQRLMEASDGKVVRVDHPGATGTVKFGGANPQSIALAMHASRMFGKQFANLDFLGGVSAGAETLGQTELLAGNSNKMVADMQDAHLKFVKKVMQRLAWYEWTKSEREDMIVKMPGVLDIVELWAPETREGDFTQYDIDIEPYSMQHQSPQSKLQSLLQIYQTVIAPAAPQMGQQGVAVDWPKFMSIVKKYANLPELDRILRDMNPEEMERVRAASDEPKMAPVTERINTRVSKAPGKDQDERMMDKMFSERQEV